jgi:hypothetical protein
VASKRSARVGIRLSPRERLTEELRDWVCVFNEAEHAHPCRRIHALREIRRLREQLKEGAVHA